MRQTRLPSFLSMRRQRGIPKLVLAKADGTVADELATKLDVKGYPTLSSFGRAPARQVPWDRPAAPVAQWAKSMLEPALPRLSTPAEVSIG